MPQSRNQNVFWRFMHFLIKRPLLRRLLSPIMHIFVPTYIAQQGNLEQFHTLACNFVTSTNQDNKYHAALKEYACQTRDPEIGTERGDQSLHYLQVQQRDNPAANGWTRTTDDNKKQVVAIFRFYGIFDGVYRHTAIDIPKELNEHYDPNKPRDLYSLNYLGQFDSGGKLGPVDNMTEEYVAFIIKMIEENGYDAEKVIIDGHSLGGMQASVIAAKLHSRGYKVHLFVDRSFSLYAWAFSVYNGSLGAAIAGIIYPMMLSLGYGVCLFISHYASLSAVASLLTIGTGATLITEGIIGMLGNSILFSLHLFSWSIWMVPLVALATTMVFPNFGAYLFYPIAQTISVVLGYDIDLFHEEWKSLPPTHRHWGALQYDPTLTSDSFRNEYEADATRHFYTEAYNQFTPVGFFQHVKQFFWKICGYPLFDYATHRMVEEQVRKVMAEHTFIASAAEEDRQAHLFANPHCSDRHNLHRAEDSKVYTAYFYELVEAVRTRIEDNSPFCDPVSDWLPRHPEQGPQP